MPMSSGMISKETSQKLSSLIYSPTQLTTLYMQFINGEHNCSKDVYVFIKNYTRTTLKACNVFDIDMENPDHLMEEEFGEMIETYNEVSQILMVMFAAGTAYGKGMFYDSFDEDFGSGLEEEEEIDDTPDIF